MKKLSLLILTSFLSALVFNVSVAFADEPDKTLRVYNSESIGAGVKVYRIQVCNKAPSWAPLKCIAKPDGNSAYFNPDGQCMDASTGKALDGEYVKGCLKEDAYEQNTGDARYPEVDTGQAYKNKKDASPPGCSDAPEQQGFKYAPECAIVKGTSADENDGKIRGTVVWDNGCDHVKSSSYIQDKFANDPDVASLIAVQIQRPALCVKYDVVAAGQDGAGKDEASAGKFKGDTPGLVDRIKKLYGDGPTPAGDEECNNNSADKNAKLPSGLTLSTPFNEAKTYSCTIQERIEGTSGSGLLANYIGALYKWAAGIVGIVAVLIMVASGIQISAAGGDSAKLDSAKNRILQSIVGLAILFLSGLILYTINPTFFTGG